MIETALLFGGLLCAVFFIGVPVGYAIIFTATALYFYYNGGSGDSAILLQRMFDGLNSFPLLAIPIFLLTGNLMNSGGITMRIFRFASALVGHCRLGLAQVNVVASMIFAGMSGSATVDAAALGAVEIPAMLDAGYDRDYSAAVTAASATLGPIIPPSVPLVIYGIVAEVSIGRLLFAGVVPGIVIGATLMILIAIQGRRGGYAKGRFKGFAYLWKSFKEGILPLLTPVILLGGILLGVFTPTEAAGVALFYAIILAMVVYREVSVMRFWELIKQTFRPTVEIMVIIAGANAFAYMIMSARLPQDVSQFVMSFSLNKYTLLIVINLALLVVGCFMETVAAITICVPVLMPLVIQYGINPVHFGLIVVFNLVFGLLTPPVGMVLFVTSRIAEISVSRLVRALLVFYIPLLFCLALITFIEPLSLWLPTVLMGASK
jgi:tripartite ATP-independent transporter DctM subunit